MEATAYAHLMKYGLTRNYWNEYIFLAYRNFRQDVIMLEGIPDIAESLPHSDAGRARLGMSWGATECAPCNVLAIAGDALGLDVCRGGRNDRDGVANPVPLLANPVPLRTGLQVPSRFVTQLPCSGCSASATLSSTRYALA